MNALKLLCASSLLVLLAGCSVQETVTQCTTAERSEWIDQEEFQGNLLNEGYVINDFKVTEGNCYEIYGRNAAGENVEIYFNPVDGSIVKQD
ncbi:PepSY domain-containing protein [Aliidiomarina sp. Khilg15.8]